MERLINSRLVWHLEKRNILIPEQAGFRHHRSTEDQVAYIAQHIEDGFQDKHHTLAVWVDMEKAFDRVRKDGLRVKLHKSGISGCMYEWISQYLNNRRPEHRSTVLTVDKRHLERECHKEVSSARRSSLFM